MSNLSAQMKMPTSMRTKTFVEPSFWPMCRMAAKIAAVESLSLPANAC
jgi:hypothetical protein